MSSSRSSVSPGEDAMTEPSPESERGLSLSPPKISGTGYSVGTAGRIRRRNRMITSCLECRRRKLKCDRLHPCSNCSKAANRDCVFLAPSMDSATRLKLAELKERMGTLERSLAKEVGSTGGLDTDHGSDLYEGDQAASSSQLNPESVPNDEKGLEPTTLAVQDAAYEDEADDDITDLGFRLGKLAMTERLGGFFRPKLADELTFSIEYGGHQLDSAALDKLLVPAFDSEENIRIPTPTWYGPAFILPRSDVLFGVFPQDITLLDCLPVRSVADRLMQQYWEAVHPIVRITHRPSMEARHSSFWDCIIAGVEPLPSHQAVIFAMLFSAVVSMSENDVFEIFGITQQALMEKLQWGTETALAKARFLRTTKVETLQALVMYLLPMCRDVISRAHSTLVGAAIRLAECMGLHRDPSEYGLPPVETHVRRLIWHQLCWLDYRTAEIQGPRLYIRKGDYTTKLPLNIDDQTLVTGPWGNEDKWTDMAFTCMRFECQDMVRHIIKERLRLERKTITLTQILGQVERFRKAIQAKYEPLLGGLYPTPLQREAAVVMSLFINRMHIAILHRYHSGVLVRIPDRLCQLTLTAGTQQLEDSVELETNPILRPWAWYSQGYQQWHVSLLMLVEVYAFPLRREADRIWNCLDYIYDTQPLPDRPGLQHLPITRKEVVEHRAEKCRSILSRCVDKLGAYRAMRRMRAPSSMTSSTAATYILSQVAGKSPPDRVTVNDADLMGSGYRSASDVFATGAQENAAMFGRGESSSLSPESSVSNSSPRPEPFQPGLTALLPNVEVYKRTNDMGAAYALQQERGNRPPVEQVVSRFDVDQAQPTSHLPPQMSASTSAAFPVSGANPNMVPVSPTPANPEGPPSLVQDQSSLLDPTAARSRYYINVNAMNTYQLGMHTTDAMPNVPPRFGIHSENSPAGITHDFPMPDIDWEEWDKLFPPHINDGNINLTF